MSSILLVDDDEGMVETLADILTARDYAVSTADSGEAAVEQVRRSGFDVVLMDIKMPGLNGVEALKAMKQMNPAIKVIMMTAFTHDDLVREARRASAVAVVAKPLDVDAVLSLVDRVVREGAAARGA
jgi:DNA-binding NtrC family response regulator